MILSVPSYVIPGTYGENVRFLAGFPQIQSVELLFYYYDAETEGLFQREKPLIASYRRRFGYGVHMPDPLEPKHERLIELTRDLCERYVLHTPEGEAEEFERMVKRWQRRYGPVFLLENLIDREFAAVAETMGSMDLCCDTGHLLMRGEEVAPFLQHYGSRIREIHLHGVVDGRDHRAFPITEPWFQRIVPLLRTFGGVLNLEVFSIEEVRTMLSVLAESGIPQGEGSRNGFL